VVYSMVQKKPRRRIAPTSGFLDRMVKDADILVTISDQLVVLDDQADVLLTQTPKFMFQRFTVPTGVHIAASSTFDRGRYKATSKAHRPAAAGWDVRCVFCGCLIYRVGHAVK
jgi:hypothetical protein